jgi:hypothetical protein
MRIIQGLTILGIAGAHKTRRLVEISEIVEPKPLRRFGEDPRIKLINTVRGIVLRSEMEDVRPQDELLFLDLSAEERENLENLISGWENKDIDFENTFWDILRSGWSSQGYARLEELNGSLVKGAVPAGADGRFVDAVGDLVQRRLWMTERLLGLMNVYSRGDAEGGSSVLSTFLVTSDNLVKNAESERECLRELEFVNGVMGRMEKFRGLFENQLSIFKRQAACLASFWHRVNEWKHQGFGMGSKAKELGNPESAKSRLMLTISLNFIFEEQCKEFVAPKRDQAVKLATQCFDAAMKDRSHCIPLPLVHGIADWRRNGARRVVSDDSEALSEVIEIDSGDFQDFYDPKVEEALSEISEIDSDDSFEILEAGFSRDDAEWKQAIGRTDSDDSIEVLEVEGLDYEEKGNPWGLETIAEDSEGSYTDSESDLTSELAPWDSDDSMSHEEECRVLLRSLWNAVDARTRLAVDQAVWSSKSDEELISFVLAETGDDLYKLIECEDIEGYGEQLGELIASAQSFGELLVDTKALDSQVRGIFANYAIKGIFDAHSAKERAAEIESSADDLEQQVRTMVDGFRIFQTHPMAEAISRKVERYGERQVVALRAAAGAFRISQLGLNFEGAWAQGIRILSPLAVVLRHSLPEGFNRQSTARRLVSNNRILIPAARDRDEDLDAALERDVERLLG